MGGLDAIAVYKVHNDESDEQKLKEEKDNVINLNYLQIFLN